MNYSILSHLKVLDYLSTYIPKFNNALDKTSIDYTFDYLMTNDDINKYFNPFLNYCPECLATGYHSWVHQLVFVQKCPIHFHNLDHKCPQCGSEICLDLNATQHFKAFSCSCGYCFLNVSSYTKLLTTWSTKLNKHALANMWHLLNQFHNLQIHCSYYYNYNQYHPNVDLKNLKLTVDFKKLNSPTLKNRRMVVMHLNHVNVHLTYNQAVKRLLNIYKESCKCIAKHLRRCSPHINSYINKLKSYRTNAFYSSTNSLNKRLNSHYFEAYAYVMWRRDVEGHSTCETVHTNLNLSNHGKSLTGAEEHLLKSYFFQYFCRELDYFCHTKGSKSIETFFTTMQVMMLEMLLCHYREWSNYTLLLMGNDCFQVTDLYQRIPTLMPLFITQLSSNTQLTILTIPTQQIVETYSSGGIVNGAAS